jgi:hypothetical protein
LCEGDSWAPAEDSGETSGTVNGLSEDLVPDTNPDFDIIAHHASWMYQPLGIRKRSEQKEELLHTIAELNMGIYNIEQHTGAWTLCNTAATGDRE